MSRRLVFLWLTLILITSAAGISAQTDSTALYWPTADEWESSTPEEQGMDSQALAEALAAIRDSGFNLHSVLIIRHGYIVTEVYVYPHTVNTLHGQQSAAKSFTSTLVGIAIDEGAIQSVDEPLLDFFPDREIANMDERKAAITIHDALTMSTGLDAGESNPELQASENIVQNTLDRPMVADPGTRFEYSSYTSHLLSAAVQYASGIDSETFVKEKLFNPLGITSYYWAKDDDGVVFGGSGLYVSSREMARLGYLFLRNGVWDDQQIVSSEWVEAATQRQAPNEDYGYQWWIDNDDPHTYDAIGYAGQRIYVVPEADLVVVFTAAAENHSILSRFVRDDILAAVQSDDPLPENEAGLAALQAEISLLSSIEPQPIPTLPPIAAFISGKTYVNFGSTWLDGISLTFPSNSGQAMFVIAQTNGLTTLPVGIDHVMRVLDTPGQTMRGLRGEWQDDSTFVIEQHFVGQPVMLQYTLVFSDYGMNVTLTMQETVAGSVLLPPVTGSLLE